MKKTLRGSKALESKVNNLETKLKKSNETIESFKTHIDDVERKYNSLPERHLSLDAYTRKENLVFRVCATISE